MNKQLFNLILACVLLSLAFVLSYQISDKPEPAEYRDAQKPEKPDFFCVTFGGVDIVRIPGGSQSKPRPLGENPFNEKESEAFK